MNAARRDGNVPGHSSVPRSNMRVNISVLRLKYLKPCRDPHQDRHIRFIAEVNDLFVVSVSDEDRDPPRAAVRNEIDSALHGIEIATAVGRDDQACGVRGRRSFLCRETSSRRRRRFPEAAVCEIQYSGIDLYVIDVLPGISEDCYADRSSHTLS